MKLFIFLVAAMSLFGAEFIPNAYMHIVLQPSKNLVWQDDVSSSERQMSYKSAMAYCETLDYIGMTNWHIPNTAELYSLTDASRTPTISSTFAHTASGCYWALHDSMKGRVGIIDFSNGIKKSSQGFEQTCYIRCVHSLK